MTPVHLLRSDARPVLVLIVMPQRRRRATQEQLLDAARARRRGDDGRRPLRDGSRGRRRPRRLEIAPGDPVRLAKSAVTAAPSQRARRAGSAQTVDRNARKPSYPRASTVAERRSHLILMGLILVALVGVALLAVPGSPIHKKATLGLDLQGGLEVVKKAVPEKGQTVDKRGPRRRGRRSSRSRIDSIGVVRARDPQAGQRPDRDRATRRARSGARRRADRPDREARALRPPGQTSSRASRSTSRASPSRTLDLRAPRHAAERGQEGRAVVVLSRQDQDEGQEDDERQARRRPRCRRASSCSRPSTSRSQRQEGRSAEGHQGARRARAHGRRHVRQARAVLPGRQRAVPSRTYYYLFNYDPKNETHRRRPVPEMTGSDLKRKGTRQDFDTQTNEPVVLMQFTASGGEQVPGHHARLVERGRVLANRNGWTGAADDQANQQFAIVLDREIKSAPSVDFDDNPNGIPGNNGAQITGIGSIHEAKTSRSCSARGRCRSSWSRSSRPTSRPRSARTRSRRRRRRRSAACSSSRSSCSSSTASSASSPSSASGSTRPSSTPRCCSSTSR